MKNVNEETYVGGADTARVLAEYEDFEKGLEPEALRIFHLMLYEWYRRHFDILKTFNNLTYMLTETMTLYDASTDSEYKVKYVKGDISEKVLINSLNGEETPYGKKYKYTFNQCGMQITFGDDERVIVRNLMDYENEDGTYDLPFALDDIRVDFINVEE